MSPVSRHKEFCGLETKTNGESQHQNLDNVHEVFSYGALVEKKNYISKTKRKSVLRVTCNKEIQKGYKKGSNFKKQIRKLQFVKPIEEYLLLQ